MHKSFDVRAHSVFEMASEALVLLKKAKKDPAAAKKAATLLRRVVKASRALSDDLDITNQEAWQKEYDCWVHLNISFMQPALHIRTCA